MRAKFINEAIKREFGSWTTTYNDCKFKLYTPARVLVILLSNGREGWIADPVYNVRGIEINHHYTPLKYRLKNFLMNPLNKNKM